MKRFPKETIQFLTKVGIISDLNKFDTLPFDKCRFVAQSASQNGVCALIVKDEKGNFYGVTGRTQRLFELLNWFNDDERRIGKYEHIGDTINE